MSRFAVAGKILVGNAAPVERDGLLAIGAGATEIDLADVTDVDSSGIAVLLSWLRAAKTRGCSVTFFNIPQSMRNLAAVYGVTDLLP